MNTTIRIEEISSLASSVLLKHGLNKQDANIVVAHLLDEELMGKASHGFYRIPGIVAALKSHNHSNVISIKKETPFSALINGDSCLGLVAAQRACTIAIDKSNKSGIAIVAVSQYVGTTGAMGYYTRQITNQNLIGICFCTSEYAVAPWGGKDPILGTNPISIGIPTGETPIIVDFSTSARTYGELMLAAKKNSRIPEGIVLDPDGKPSTDPNDANNGCQLPMAEHKGYGLGLAIEILAGVFVGSKAGKDAVVGSDGMLFITFSPDLFVSKNVFLENVDLLLNEIKNSGLAFDKTEIRIPGQDSYKKYAENKTKNQIEINTGVLTDIMKLNS